jgi:hypothetical protein
MDSGVKCWEGMLVCWRSVCGRVVIGHWGNKITWPIGRLNKDVAMVDRSTRQRGSWSRFVHGT